jgi:translation initiation factor 1 (eIF-1/SUI1)
LQLIYKQKSMLRSRLLFVFFLFALTIATSILFSNCANIIPPLGGPRDSLPPRLLSVNPKDSTLNFDARKITLVFNEFVELQNLRENILVSPTPKTDPIIESKLRTVTIRIKDTLDPNTTYTIDFGNAIKDINEANVAKNFTYTFSTGTAIDDFELSGRIIIAETGDVDSTIVAMLHRSGDDSALIKEKPRYIAKPDGKGFFQFHNLPAGTFYLYALKDESGQRKYFSGRQAFAFADQPVVIGDSNAPVTLYAFVEKKEEKTASGTSSVRPGSVNKILGDKGKQPTEQDKRLRFKTNLDNNQQDLLTTLDILFTDPLKNFDTSKIQFVNETYQPLTTYSFVKDSTSKKVSLRFGWQENTAYNIIVDKDFAEDSSGRKIPRTDTLKFKTLREADYGNVKIRFRDLDMNKKPVLLLLQGEEIKFSTALTIPEFTKKLFKPGDYDIRVLYDTNGNGRWDTGEFFKKHLQPEKVEKVEKKLTVKANWDNDITIDLSARQPAEKNR